MSDQTGITELELQELLKDLGGEPENEVSEKEILLDLQGLSDDWEDDLSEEEESWAEDLSEEEESWAENLSEEEEFWEDDLLEEEEPCEPDLPKEDSPKLSASKTSKKKTKKKKKKRKKRSKGWKVFLSAILGILLVLTVIAAFAAGIYISGKQQMTDAGNGVIHFPENLQVISEYEGRKVTYEDKIYQMQQDASRVLLIGKNTDGACSMVLMNFNSNTGNLSAMPIPRELLNLDFSSPVYHDDIQEEVSSLLYGLPIHGYMMIDLQTAAEKTGQILSNTASDKGCREILMDFVRQTVRGADDDITSIWQTIKDMRDMIQWNMDRKELCYLYMTTAACSDSRMTEAQVRDSDDLLPAILKTFYSAS